MALRYLVRLVEPNRGRILRELVDGEPDPTGTREQPPYASLLIVDEDAAAQAQRRPGQRRRETTPTPPGILARATIQGLIVPPTYEADRGFEHELQLNNNGLLQQLESGPVTLDTPGQVNAAFRGRPAGARPRPGRERA